MSKRDRNHIIKLNKRIEDWKFLHREAKRTQNILLKERDWLVQFFVEIEGAMKKVRKKFRKGCRDK